MNYEQPTLAQALKAKAVCESTHPAEAVSALLGAAADILSLRFAPAEVGAIIVEVVEQSLALAAPVGRA